MAPPVIFQLKNLGASAAQKKKRTIIRPACFGSILLIMYLMFMYMIFISFENNASKDSGDVHHLTSSVASNIMTSSPKQEESAGNKEMSSDIVDHQPLQQSSSAENEHSDTIYFCGDCRWKDSLISCDEQVAWEVEHGKSSSEIEAKKRNLAFCKRPPYDLSPLCGGCVRALSPMTSKMYRDGIPCYDIMLRRLKHGNASSIEDAALIAANKFEECQPCLPATCWKNYFNDSSLSMDELDKDKKGYLTKYWRFDQAAPKICSSTTLVLPSIPKKFRIPPSRFADIEAFLTEKYNAFEASNDTNHVEIFIEYNPALAPIPSKMREFLPRGTAYAVALRVTPANNCFSRDQMLGLPEKVWSHIMMSATNLLGLALLDENYQMLEGYDIVVDIATQLGLQRNGYGTTYFGEPTFMDYRLFTLNNQLYLHANADVTVVTQLDIRDKKHKRLTNKGEFIIENVYGKESGLQVTLLHQFNTIWSGGEEGKNFALFALPNSTHPDAPDSIYAEIDIHPYHKVHQVYLDEFEMLQRNIARKRRRRNYSVTNIMMRKVLSNGNLTVSEESPPPSFFTIDEHWFPGNRPAFRKEGHGGACCVSLSRGEVLAQGNHINLSHNSWGENDYLLMGVAHTSVNWRRWYSDKDIPDSEKAMIPHTHYASFFYAFEPRPPFNLRARSGYFCLGFAGEDGTEGMSNPHSILTKNRKLSQHNETFSCPQIHYVSSFIEKVGDSSSTVIGYGLNDCTPRLVEVEKKEIGRMLFSDPFDMKIESRSAQAMDDRIKSFEVQNLPLDY